MKKKLVRLTEADLHRVIKETVNTIINEAGDTDRGSYMLGRKGQRDIVRGDVSAYLDTKDKAGHEDAFEAGIDDEIKVQNGKMDKRTLKNRYDTYKFGDMDKLGKMFIEFIEKYHYGTMNMLQTIVDFESGNETGYPCSPLPTIIPEFEDAVLNGQKCTPEMRKAIKKAYNEWWYYAKDQLMPEEEDY